MANRSAANFPSLITNMRLLFSMIGILLLVTSCGISRSPRDDRALQNNAATESLSAHMALRVLREDGTSKTFAIVLQNPQHALIQSVRAWVQFDSSAIYVSDLTIEDGRFSLFAQGERGIDSEGGFIKIGAATSEPITDALITLATFTVRSTSSDASVLTFYDWRIGGDGHTAVLSIDHGNALNILSAPSAIDL